jgi:hypothetical protein
MPPSYTASRTLLIVVVTLTAAGLILIPDFPALWQRAVEDAEQIWPGLRSITESGSGAATPGSR